MCTALHSDFSGLDGLEDLRLKGHLDEHIATSLYVLPISQDSSVAQAVEYGLRRIIETRILHQPDFIHMIGIFFAKDFLKTEITYGEQLSQCEELEKLPKEDWTTSRLILTNTAAVF